MSTTIPIRNLYFLLLYAWDSLQEGQVVNIGGVESTSMVELLTSVLCRGTRHLMRRGLDRGYLAKREETSSFRGRIDLATTTKRLSLLRAQAFCQFDELSIDVIHNQILRSTFERLSHVRGLNDGLRADTVGLLRELREASPIRLNRMAFRRLQFHRNNGFYGFLMKVCELLQQQLLMDEAGNRYRFQDFDRDEKKMAGLFERFVFNFLRHEQSRFRVCSEMIRWNAIAEDAASLSLLPSMRTDISLRSTTRTIIIDTKYYKESLQTYFGKPTIHSNNLYQICAYLGNIERNGGLDASAEGILLYPAVSQRLDLRYRIQGHMVRVCTLDLNQDWPAIRRDLLGLVLTEA